MILSIYKRVFFYYLILDINLSIKLYNLVVKKAVFIVINSKYYLFLLTEVHKSIHKNMYVKLNKENLN